MAIKIPTKTGVAFNAQVTEMFGFQGDDALKMLHQTHTKQLC